MSYILEALKESEQARRQNTAAWQYSLLPTLDEAMAAQRRWPYALVAALLLVNAAVIYLWLRPTFPDHALAVKTLPLTQALKTPAANPADIAPSIPVDKLATAVTGAVPTTIDVPRARSGPATDTPAPRVLAPVKVLAAKKPKALERQSRPVSVQGTEPPPAALPERQSRPVAKETVPPPAAIPERSVQTVAANNPKPAAAVTSEQQKEQAKPGELPSALQQELPSLSVAGFIRDKGSIGMVIVNDKLVREGDEIAPGLKLEKIHDDNVVFTYKGHRFIR